MVLSSSPRVLSLVAALTLALAACDSGPARDAADLVLRGGKIVFWDRLGRRKVRTVARDEGITR